MSTSSSQQSFARSFSSQSSGRSFNSQVSGTSSSLEQFTSTVSPKINTSESLTTERSSSKKKVLVTKRAEKPSEDIHRPNNYRDFITPDKMDGFRDRLTAFIEHSTIKNEQKRLTSFQLGAPEARKEELTQERKLLRPQFMRPTDQKMNISIDSNKLCKEKEKLLQTQGCFSLSELISKSGTAACVKRLDPKIEDMARLLESYDKRRERVTDETKGNQGVGQRLAVVNSSESIRRASADDKEFHFSKRNFEQLATIPEVKRNEQDSLVGTTSTKIEKRAKSDIHPKTITFLDSKRNRQLRFPIFAERDLKFINQDMQTTIHDADADDDVETEEEQLNLAFAKVFEDLLEGLNQQDYHKKIYKPRYFTDPRNPRKKVMSYSVTNPEQTLKPPSTSFGKTNNTPYKGMSSVSTSDRSMNSWLHQEGGKEHVPQQETQSSQTSETSSQVSYTSSSSEEHSSS